MNAVSFLIALAALSLGTYVMRFAGVKLGGAIATKGERRRAVPVPTVGGSDDASTSVEEGASVPPASAGERSHGQPTSVGDSPNAPTASAGEGPNAPTASAAGTDGGSDSTSRVTMWMDRATVVLIGAVFATTAVFDGQDIADPARLIGVGVGVLAAILRVPMLLCVFLGMGVCAVIRMIGIL